MTSVWGPWIPWTQGPMPVAGSVLVKAEMDEVGSGDIIGPLAAKEYDWDYAGDPIVRYKVKRPKALIALMDIAKNIKEKT